MSNVYNYTELFLNGLVPWMSYTDLLLIVLFTVQSNALIMPIPEIITL